MSKLADDFGSEVKKRDWKGKDEFWLRGQGVELENWKERSVTRGGRKSCFLPAASNCCLPLPSGIASAFGRALSCRCPECGRRRACHLPFRAACAKWRDAQAPQGAAVHSSPERAQLLGTADCLASPRHEQLDQSLAPRHAQSRSPVRARFPANHRRSAAAWRPRRCFARSAARRRISRGMTSLAVVCRSCAPAAEAV